MSRLFAGLLADPRANRAAFLGFASLLAYPLGFAISAVVARVLGAEEYGVYSFVFSVLAFAATFFRFGVSNASCLLIAQSADAGRHRRIVGATCVAFAAIGGAFSLVVFALGLVVDSVFDTAINALLRTCSPLVVAMPLEYLIPSLARGMGSIRMLGVYKLLPKLLYLGALLGVLTTGLAAISWLVTLQLLSILVASFAVLWALKPSLQKLGSHLRQLAATTRGYGFPLYLGQMFDGATTHLDKLLIPFFFDTRELGYYFLATMMSSAIVVLPASLCTTIFRDLVRSERLPSRVLWVNSAVTAVAFLGFLALAYPAVLLIYGEEFLPVARLCWPLAVAALVQGLYQPFTMFLEGKGKGLWIRDNFFYQGLARIAGSMALIPFLGPFGAALAVAASRLVHLVGYYFLMRRFDREAAL